MDKITIKPGILVSLSVRASGGVTYVRQDIVKAGEETDTGTDVVLENEETPTSTAPEVAEWKTRRTIEDPAEHKRATKARSKCRSLISSVCTNTAFGLLCPESKEVLLDEAIAEARGLAAAHNNNVANVRTRVQVFVIKGRIAQTDQEATRAIADEVGALVAEMKQGLLDTDAERVRDAAMKAKKMAAMLDVDTGRKVTAAVEKAREVAKEIVKALAKKEDAVEIVRQANLDVLDSARSMFLTFEEQKVEGEAMAAVDARPLDFDDSDVEENDSVQTRTEDESADMKAADNGRFSLDTDVRTLDL
jgi:HPt (histidine-containing phosphotransfer) domain-containing protein